MHPEPSESLEARLRALPPPPVPGDLQARLLATIPAAMPMPRQRWRVWVGVAGVLAAASVLAVLAWLGRERTNRVPSPSPTEFAREDPPRPPDDSAGIPRWPHESETFNWPLEETSPLTVSTSIPPDLLD